ncbi:MAG: hypothetical protein HN411_03270 [Waddliaceae bacterium]|nr:hypothetical protein [Waddliaceae bacterium]MBT3578935.1 hypothetical protein [Waddliaceae bacterium]MBT4445506.1 hypothetical protein [Waddliaceae bacterium]MBT6928997.1 hypothetical protein [Waddliaceae bacterium]MBT7263995.1 hypothetical protein [Waddliaceae bacterium]
MPPYIFLFGIGITVVVGIVGGIIFYKLIRWWEQWRRVRRMRWGIKAEKRIDSILRSYGYDVTGVQKPLSMTMYVDGKDVTYQVRPDAIARKKKSIYVVEAKTGTYASSPFYSSTRRQMMEYYHSAPFDGVLLVDADARTVKVVTFPRAPTIRRGGFLRSMLAFLVGACVGAAMIYWVL